MLTRAQKRLVARWLPECALVFVTDSSFAVLDLLDWVSRLPHVSLITRLRMDAQLYDFAPERKPGQKGRPRSKGARRPLRPSSGWQTPRRKGKSWRSSTGMAATSARSRSTAKPLLGTRPGIRRSRFAGYWCVTRSSRSRRKLSSRPRSSLRRRRYGLGLCGAGGWK